MREAIEREHIHNQYVGLTREQIRAAALERVRHYSHPAPAGADRRFSLLRDAWQWVAEQHQHRST